MKLTILSVIISLLPLIACDVCEPGHFWSSKLGCSKCFCSGVTDKCHAGSFYLKAISVDTSRVKGFLDWPNRPAVPLRHQFRSGHKYEFKERDASGGFIWELPFPFYGNGARSYGGEIGFDLETELNKGGDISDHSITIRMISSEVNISIVAMNSAKAGYYLVGPYSLIYRVPLTEQNAYIDGDRSRPATRADVMRALLTANKILVVASPQTDRKSIRISYIEQQVAVDEVTSIGTDTIEVCDCSEGYSGNSCETCRDPLCEPCQNTQPCEELCYENGICLGCPQCNKCIWYNRNITNKDGSVFGACEPGDLK